MPRQAPEEEKEVRIPLYYERYQEEREKRFTSELSHLEAEIRHNRESIDELRYEIKSLRTEMKEGLNGLRTEMMGEINSLRMEMNNRFRWTIGLLLPIVFGVLAIFIRDFFMGP